MINVFYLKQSIKTIISRIFVCFFFLLVFVATGCKKEILSTSVKEIVLNSKSEKDQQHTRTSTINASYIRDWLEDQQTNTSARRNLVITNILDNMQDANIYAERLNDNSNLIIVPLLADTFSNCIDTSLATPLQFLILVEDYRGILKRGDLVFFYPENATNFQLPTDAFSKYFTHQTFPVDGTFTLVTLDDVKQYEMDIDDGIQKEFRLWQGRAQNSAVDDPICIDWYLVTTIYYSDGTYEIFETFLYTECQQTGGGGGTGETPPGAPIGEQSEMDHVFLVKHKSNSQEMWEMFAGYHLIGTRFSSQPANNVFSSISYNNPPGSAIIFSNASHSATWHSWYIIYNTHSNIYTINNPNTSATMSFQGKTTYPNQGNRFEIHVKVKLLQASIFFHQEA
ncbi:MAG: hypothetical protein WKF35_00535 [Ferruginibacter sp.]